MPIAPKGAPLFWSGPLRYLRWSSRERPAYFWSVVAGALGPIMLVTVPPARKALGYEKREFIPMTYPIPAGPRQKISGYDD